MSLTELRQHRQRTEQQDLAAPVRTLSQNSPSGVPSSPSVRGSSHLVSWFVAVSCRCTCCRPKHTDTSTPSPTTSLHSIASAQQGPLLWRAA